MSLPPERTTVNLSKERNHLQPVRFIPPNNAAFNPITNEQNTTRLYTQETEMCPLVKEEEIFTNLMNLLQMMKDTKFIQPGENGYHTKYKWSFYETFGIPAYSKTEYCLKNNYRTLFKKFNYRGPVRTWWRGNPSNNFLDAFFETPLDTCIFNMFKESYSYKYKHPSQPDNLFLIINWNMQNPIKDMTNYKLHFMVDEAYALYVLMKAMMIVRNRDKRKGVNIQRIGKIVTNFRASKFPSSGPRVSEESRNTVSPTIVIYTASDSADEAREILEELIAAFPEHEEIGLMSLGQSNLIAYGNIRLNKLICYAQGDRNTKYDIKRGNTLSGRSKILTYNEIIEAGVPENWTVFQRDTEPPTMFFVYTDPDTKKRKIQYSRPDEFPPLTEDKLNPISTKLIPPWVTNMISKCNSSQGEINRRSQIFFGINFCDPMYSNLHSTCTVDPLCYFSVDETCLDPNTIRGVEGIEPSGEFSSALTIRSANTGRLEGGGATRGGRRSSRRRRTKNKKFKKLRKTRR